MTLTRLIRRAVVTAAVVTLSASATIVGGSAALAAPPSTAIALSPSSGPAGTAVTVTGTGFAKKSAGRLTAGSTTAGFTTDGSGAFSGSIAIPTTSDAQVTVTATTGGKTASAPFRVTYSPASGTTTPPVTSTTPPSGTAPTISDARLRFGVSTPGGARANAELDAVASLVGEGPSLVLSFYDFGQEPPIADLDSVAARGASSLLTWEPWRWGGGAVQPAYTNDRIIAGDHDAYIARWAAALAAWGKPLYLRYGHEMNGDWYPWADGVNTNAAGSYAAAWRHVHDIFAVHGATNVSWVWSPNVPYWGSTELPGLFPGVAYVDVMGLDAYNWGTAASWSTWTTPSALLENGITRLRSLAPGTPILIAETSSAEDGGSKAEWNSSLVSYLAQQGDVMGFIWFHHDKEVDWRIDSSSSSAGALADALARR